MILPFIIASLYKEKKYSEILIFLSIVLTIFMITILPTLEDFINSIQTNGLILRILELKLTAPFGILVPVYPLLYIWLFIAFLFTKSAPKNIILFTFVVYLLIPMTTRINAQWFLWFLPFFIVLASQNLKLLLFAVPVILCYVVSILAFEDRFLLSGIYSPMIPSIYSVGFIDQTIFYRFGKETLVFYTKVIMMVSGVLLIYKSMKGVYERK